MSAPLIFLTGLQHCFLTACIAFFDLGRVQEFDLLQMVQLAEPVTAVLAAILSECAGPMTRFACC